MKKRNKKDINKIISTIFFWLLFLVYLNFFSPGNFFSFSLFYIFFFFSLLFTLRLFLSQTRSFLLTTIITVYLLLRQNGLDNLVNTFILLSIFITFEIYFQTKS